MLPTPDQLRRLAELLETNKHPDLHDGDGITGLLHEVAQSIPFIIKTMLPDDVMESHSQCSLILAALNTRVAEVLAAEQRDYIELLEAGEVLLIAVNEGARSLRENSDATAASYDADFLSREGEYARRVFGKFRAKVFSDYDENGDAQPNLIAQHYLVESPPKAQLTDVSVNRAAEVLGKHIENLNGGTEFKKAVVSRLLEVL